MAGPVRSGPQGPEPRQVGLNPPAVMLARPGLMRGQKSQDLMTRWTAGRDQGKSGVAGAFYSSSSDNWIQGDVIT